MRILLVGGEAAGLQALRALSRTSHTLVGVLTTPAPSGFRGASLESSARKSGVPVWPASLVRDVGFAARVREREVDLLLNVHSLHLIHPEILAAPRVGAFNLHPGPLPRYAGLNAPLWAVFRGEADYGATLHWMSPRIDAGPIAYQQRFPVADGETGLTLSRKCVETGLVLVTRLLEAAEEGARAIPRIEQALTEREYLSPGPPQEGRIGWDRPAAEIVRFVRACDFRPLRSPWGAPKARLCGREIAVLSAHATGRPCDAPPGALGTTVGDAVEVACLDEWVRVEDVRTGDEAAKAADALGRSQV